MALRDCPKCGGEVRLGAVRISVNRKRGVSHYVAHMKATDCTATKEFTCVALKPYGKPAEWEKLKARWNGEAS